MVWEEKKWLEEKGAGCRGGRGVRSGWKRGDSMGVKEAAGRGGRVWGRGGGRSGR
jgi:hypothetical protein